MIFFRPTRSFAKWVVDRAKGRLIIEAGCGEGHFLKKLVKAGGHAIGVDPWVSRETARDLFRLGIQTVAMEAEFFSLITQRDDCLLLFCRPCHDGFVARTLHANAGNEVLYISKPENILVDIPGYFRANRLNTPRCREERAFQIVPRSVPCPSN